MKEVRLEKVIKRYGSVVALDEVSISVGEGEFVCLLGPSGCGKTTLLRAIAGLQSVEGGQISIGKDVVSSPGSSVPPDKRNLGLVFQSYALWPHKSVYDNISYSLELRGWSKRRIADKVEEVMRLVGLEGLDDRFPHELSGGQMQRVAVARSIAPEPDVLLFDEPLSNLDAKRRESMRFELRRIQQRTGITSIYVTHDQDEAMVLSDRIVLMNEGRVVQEGTPRELYDRPQTRFAADFLGLCNFFDGKVVDQQAGTVSVLTPDGLTVEGTPAGSCQVGAQVTALVRPEDVHLQRADPAGFGEHSNAPLTGLIDQLVFLGNLADVFVRVGGRTIRSQAAPSVLQGYQEGDEVLLELAADNVIVLDDGD